MIESVAARIRGEDAFVVDLDHSAQIASTTAAIQAAEGRKPGHIGPGSGG